MCLEIVLRGKEKKAALAKLKDTITVWKVLTKPHPKWNPGYYVTDICDFRVHAGEVTFKQPAIDGYRGGGHFWLTKAGAVNWNYDDPSCRIVRCTIKKLDINAIGFQDDLVVVVKKATFPKYIGKRG